LHNFAKNSHNQGAHNRSSMRFVVAHQAGSVELLFMFADY